jgi:hypothetical protein
MGNWILAFCVAGIVLLVIVIAVAPCMLSSLISQMEESGQIRIHH